MEIPNKLGKYEIKHAIGRGSMGVVYEGFDPFSNRKVAVKVAITEALKDPEQGERYRTMFFNEAYTAGMLKHPNIVEIIDAGADDDICYIVMELVEGGQTLKPYCKPDNLLSLQKVIEITFKCAKALDYAHRQGVVHRDIKPTNLLLTKDLDVKIGDFSIAHMASQEDTHTMPMGFIGSPRYMSPEQVQEETISNQTDLFSLGIIMYELLTGKHPFNTDSFSRLIFKIINEQQAPMRGIRVDLPEILDKIVYHALQKDIKKRYKMGMDFAADLSLAFDYLDSTEEQVDLKQRYEEVKSLDFFRDFSEAQIWEIMGACHWQIFNKDNAIIKQGEIDDSFFIIISGDVRIQRDGVKIGYLKAGDCFGEMGYLAKTERTAEVIANDRVSVMKINDSAMQQVSKDCQLFFSKMFIATLIKRLDETSALLVNQNA